MAPSRSPFASSLLDLVEPADARPPSAAAPRAPRRSCARRWIPFESSAIRASSSSHALLHRPTSARSSCFAASVGASRNFSGHRGEVAAAFGEVLREPDEVLGALLVEELLEVEDALLELLVELARRAPPRAGAAGVGPDAHADRLRDRGARCSATRPAAPPERARHVRERGGELLRRRAVAAELARRPRASARAGWRVRTSSCLRLREPLGGGRSRAAGEGLEPVAEDADELLEQLPRLLQHLPAVLGRASRSASVCVGPAPRFGPETVSLSRTSSQ